MTAATLGIAIALASLGQRVEVPSLAAPPPTTERSMQQLEVRAQTLPPQDADVRIMLAALNERRAAQGLVALDLDPELCKIASAFAAEMATRHFFGHTDPEGETPFARMDRAHIHYGYAGENIALDASATAASDALWQSKPHRENILEPHYLRVGIGAVNAPSGELFVEDFSD